MLYEVITAFVKKEECSSLDVWKQKQVDVEQILSTAFAFKGTPYLWGGTSPKMLDCSGFTKTIRITSYNVCYTKLLRFLSIRHGLILPKLKGFHPRGLHPAYDSAN